MSEDATPESPSPLPTPKNSKKGILVSAIAFFSALASGAGVYFLTPLNEAVSEHAKRKKEETVNLLEVSFLPLPDMLINLKSEKIRGNVLKANFVLEIGSASDKEQIDHFKPVFTDQFQMYLRELQLTDIQSAGGLERIRQELLKRVNTVVAPLHVRNVLFKEFLVQ